MRRDGKRFLVLLLPCFLIGFMVACSPFPTIDALVPPRGRVGDVVVVRDRTGASLAPAGIVHFGEKVVPQALLWTAEDVYVQVPSGTAGTVPVRVSIGGFLSNSLPFTVVDLDLQRIMLFGDSVLSWGTPAVLRDLIQEDPDLNALDLVVLDQGRNSERLSGSGTLPRWQNAIQYSTPDLVILMEGTLDIADSSHVLMGDIQQGLIALVDEAQFRGLDPVLCTLLPRAGSIGDEESPTTEEFNDWLKSYAGGIGLSVIDLYEEFVTTPDWQDLYFDLEEDSIHPNAAGRQKMAECMREQIREELLPPCTE